MKKILPVYFIIVQKLFFMVNPNELQGDIRKLAPLQLAAGGAKLEALHQPSAHELKRPTGSRVITFAVL